MIMTKTPQEPMRPLPAFTPDKLWRLALVELRQQMTKTTFNALLVDSRILATASTSAFWVVVVRNEYAWEWLTYQLFPVIERTLVGLVGKTVTICFIPRAMRKIYYEPSRKPSARISQPV